MKMASELSAATCAFLTKLAEIADSYGLDKQWLLRMQIGYLTEYQDSLYYMLEKEMMK